MLEIFSAVVDFVYSDSDSANVLVLGMGGVRVWLRGHDSDLHQGFGPANFEAQFVGFHLKDYQSFF